MRYDTITFDCYGTLIDWDSGLMQALAGAAERDGVNVDPAALRRRYAEAEWAVEAEPFRPYREVIAEAARRAASSIGWQLSEERARAVAASLPEWLPFADTNPALERLKRAGYRLGILSNVDEDLLAGTRRHFTVEFDLIVTAEQVGSYKPAHAHFLTARERIGDRPWLHAAQSYVHDVVPCAQLGIPCAWINRHGSAPLGDERPARELGSLGELAEWLA